MALAFSWQPTSPCGLWFSRHPGARGCCGVSCFTCGGRCSDLVARVGRTSFGTGILPRGGAGTGVYGGVDDLFLLVSPGSGAIRGVDLGLDFPFCHGLTSILARR